MARLTEIHRQQQWWGVVGGDGGRRAEQEVSSEYEASSLWEELKEGSRSPFAPPQLHLHCQGVARLGGASSSSRPE
jgi:hypothetical protein